MAINQPQQQSSPLERFALLLQTVNQGKDVYDKFKASSKASDQESLYSDPNSEDSRRARDLASKLTGSPIAETASRKQIEAEYGPLVKLSEEGRSRDFQKELIGLKGQEERKTALAATRKDRLPAPQVLNVNQGNAIPGQLKQISATIEQNQDSFGPVMGFASSLNPYDTKAKTIDAQLRASAQSFGRYMEGGVLRKEDEEKYRKMFPTLSDTPEVARNKLAIVNKLLIDKQKSDVGALEQQGYSVRGLQADLGQGQIPKVLRTRAGQGAGGLVPEAQAAAQQGPHGAAVVQNGVVFTWNPQTGTYESL